MKLINVPTLVTLSRIILTPVIIVLLYFPQTKLICVLVAIVYIIASLSDYVDGKLARSSGQVTSLGKFLDPLADKILNCSILIMFSVIGVVPAWVTILIVCRELFITGLRAVAVEEGYIMAADRYGKLKTVFQTVAIIPLSLSPAFFSSTLHFWGMALLYVALVLTVFSGINYIYRFYLFLKAK